MNYQTIALIALSSLLFSCNTANKKDAKKENPVKKEIPSYKNKGHELVSKMIDKVGDYNALSNKKDVVYTYTYQTPDGKADVSTEKYIFDGELSYGSYEKHERTFPDLEDTIEQGYNGNEFWLKHNGKIIDEPNRLKRVAFNRPTNYYWFAMFQKLLDPGLTYEYLGDKTIDTASYDIVKVSFESKNDKPTDIYQLYINKETMLVDQFLFTVADFGVMETPFIMKIEHENIDGLLIPTKRKYKKSTWNADIDETPWINVTWSNIKFNNNLTATDFKK